jgi:sugar phosphate isomerase/epimerase
VQFAICQWYPALSYEAIESMRADGVTALEPGPSFLLDKDEATLIAEAGRLQDAGSHVYSVTALERAALSGAECLVIHPSGRVTVEEEAQRWRQLYASLETLVPEAESVGVRLALENMLPGHLGAEAASIRRVVDDFDSATLGVCFDTGHAHLNEGGVPEAFAILRERIINFHMQDNDGNRDRHLQPPYGTIDWEAFAPQFRSMEFAHPAAVEAAPWNGGTWGMLLREVHTLFSEGRLTLRLGNSLVRVICKQCGRYRMGTPEDWYCGCGPHGGTGDG